MSGTEWGLVPVWQRPCLRWKPSMFALCLGTVACTASFRSLGGFFYFNLVPGQEFATYTGPSSEPDGGASAHIRCATKRSILQTSSGYTFKPVQPRACDVTTVAAGTSRCSQIREINAKRLGVILLGTHTGNSIIHPVPKITLHHRESRFPLSPLISC
jgi:hypothetical protein